MSKPKRSREEIISSIATVILENATDVSVKPASDADLRENLVEIRKDLNVTGYILKNQTEAFFDVDDQDKLVEYAMLASETAETYATLNLMFMMGDMETAVIECPELKLLCFMQGENSVSVFMEKKADHNVILQRLKPQTQTQTD